MGMHRMHVHPPAPSLHPPLAVCIPPTPQPERLVMRKDEAVGNKKKCKFVYLDLKIFCRVSLYIKNSHVDPEPDPDPAHADPDPGEGVGQPKCPPLLAKS